MIGRARRILIVDDVPENLELLEARLTATGYESVSARNGEHALNILRTENVDAIVSDILMPEMDGYQLCRACKSDPDLKTIPFIFYTATYTEDKDRDFARGLGADAFLIKPTETQLFLQALDAAIAERSGEADREPSSDDLPAAEYYRLHNARLFSKLSKKLHDQALLVSAIEQTSEGIAILTPDGVIQYANHSMMRLWAAPSESTTKQDLFRDSAGAFWSSAHEAQWQALRSHSTWSGQVRRRTADDRVIDCQESLTPVRLDSGALTSFVLVSRDITEQLRLEARAQLAERMAAIGTLAGGVAHDFNNALAGIVGLAELTAMDVTDQPEALENVQQILATCERAREIIAEVLAFSRRTESQLERVHLRTLTREVLRTFAPTLPPQVRLVSELSAEADAVLANASQIHRVLMNLLTNARQAIGEDSGTITVTLEPMPNAAPPASTDKPQPSGPHLRLSVRDTGAGIQPENLPHVFEPYFTTKNRTSNAGLGLALVHSIVTAHGGDIHVSSEPGKGTLFEILLPRHHGVEARTRLLSEEPPAGGQERVLVVDDEEVVLDVLRRNLDALGYQVVSASGVTDALEVFGRESGRFDLLVTDKQMPDGTGFDLVRTLRLSCPELPAVLCSGYLEDPDVDRAREEGIDDILAKPVRRAQLADCVRRVLTRRAAERSACRR